MNATERGRGDSLFPALDHVPDAVIVAGSDNRIRYTNPATASLLGWSADELAGQPLTTIIPPRLRAAHQVGFDRYVRTRSMRRAGHPMRVAALHRDGREIDIDLMLAPLPGGALDDSDGDGGGGGEPGDGLWAMGLLRDVGDLIALERELDVGRYLRASIDVSAALNKATDTQEAFDALLPALCAHLDWQLAAIWQPDDARDGLECVAVWHDGTLPDAATAMTDGIAMRFGEGLPGKVWTRQHPMLLAADAGPADFPRAATARAHELTTGLAFALLGTTGPLGVIEFWSRTRHDVDDDLQAVLLSIGRQLGLFLERMDADAELRRALDVLQSSLLPAQLPVVPRLRLGAHYQAASGQVAVGGDFFDVFPLTGGWWAFVIADVCGKGAGAAAVTAMARYTIRTAALDHEDPRDVLAILNQAMLTDSSDRPFLTACLVFVNARPDGALAVITSAGHPLPLLRTADGAVRPAGQPGDLLGVLASPAFDSTPVEMGLGDTLLLYTDGFTEARDSDGRQLGERGLAQLLGQASSIEPARLVEELTEGLRRHIGSRHTTDDAAALAITVG